MTLPCPTIDHVMSLEKWGYEYTKIYQRFYHKIRKKIITDEELNIFLKMRRINHKSYRMKYNRLSYDKGDKQIGLRINNEKVLVKFD